MEMFYRKTYHLTYKNVNVGTLQCPDTFSVLVDHAGFSGIFLGGESGARAIVGPGATRGRLFGKKEKKKRKKYLQIIISEIGKLLQMLIVHFIFLIASLVVIKGERPGANRGYLRDGNLAILARFLLVT